jgi:hypothetical protein
MLDSNSNAGCQKIITGLTCGADRVLIEKKIPPGKPGGITTILLKDTTTKN